METAAVCGEHTAEENMVRLNVFMCMFSTRPSHATLRPSFTHFMVILVITTRIHLLGDPTSRYRVIITVPHNMAPTRANDRKVIGTDNSNESHAASRQ